MALKLYDETNVQAIADAIRSKNARSTHYKISDMAAAISELETGLDLLPQDTVSGAIANFPDGSNGYPVVSLEAAIVAKQEGSGDPSPSNVRAISGFTGLTLTECGKNLFPTSFPSNVINATIQSDGSITSATNARTFAIKLNKNVNLTYSCSSRQSWTVGVSNDLPTVGGSCTFLANLTSRDTYTFSTGDNIYIVITVNSEQAFNDAPTNHVMFEVGSTATSYAPYVTPTTHDVTWQTEAGTVYRGTLNVTTGVLTVTHGKVDFGDLDWVLSGSGTSARWRNTEIQNLIQKPTSTLQIPDMKMEQYLPINYGVSLANYPDYMAVLTTGELITYAYDTVNKPKGLCIYPLANPQVYQLTPEQVTTILGENNIFADTGDVEVTYRADVDLYIDKKIAEGA